MNSLEKISEEIRREFILLKETSFYDEKEERIYLIKIGECQNFSIGEGFFKSHPNIIIKENRPITSLLLFFSKTIASYDKEGYDVGLHNYSSRDYYFPRRISSCHYAEAKYYFGKSKIKIALLNVDIITFDLLSDVIAFFRITRPVRMLLEHGLKIDDNNLEGDNAVTTSFKKISNQKMQKIIKIILPNRKIFTIKTTINKNKILKNNSKFWKVICCDYKLIYKPIFNFTDIIKFM